MRTIQYLAVVAIGLSLAWVVGTTAVSAVNTVFARTAAQLEAVNP